MTSWRYMTLLFLFVFLSLIDPSKEGCLDYLKMDKWVANLTDTVPIVSTKDPKDTVRCTIEKQYLNGVTQYCFWLRHCFDLKCPKMESEECKGDISQEVHFHHFACLVAKEIGQPLKGCEYDTVCALHSRTPFTAHHLEHKYKEDNETTDNSANTLKVLLLISGTFNAIALVVILFMCYRWRQGKKQKNLTLVSNGNLAGAQSMTEIKTDTPLPSEKWAEEENSHLMTPHVCVSVLAHSADTNKDCRATGEEMPH
ncbi:uncharacterized protein LOC121957224 isoform X2 [Plectropomus leopardus]|uniref:uncharacterized protein LOC121957224 isoform X2 n=1 Tax=Plectropomus leopardus TaxID=160734 RepID=UPI001C4CB969|nr:uncharacterized protein LOC121957224 isoform X2 [Plectropomus leopardus]